MFECNFNSLWKDINKKYPVNLDNQKQISSKFDNEGSYDGTFYDSNNLPINNHPIEKISHHIWIKSHQNKGRNGNIKEISEKNLKNLIDKSTKIDSSSSNFIHILWTNDKGLIPDTIDKLKDTSIEIREINTLNDDIENLDLIVGLIEDGIYGLAVDVLKYEVVRIHGGIVSDLNYHFYTHDLSPLLDSYSFFTQSMTQARSVMHENSMFAANKEHIILTETCNMINMSLKFIKDNGYHSSCTNSELVHDLSFDQWNRGIINNLNNKEIGNIDEIFSITFNCDKVESLTCNIIGRDINENSWGF